MTESDTFKKEDEDIAPRQLLALAGYKKHWGNISAACEEAGISRNTFYRWKEHDFDFIHALADIELEHIEMAKAKLKELAIIKGNMTALIFFLKNKAPDEFSDRHVITNNANSPSVLEHLTDEELDEAIRRLEEQIKAEDAKRNNSDKDVE